MIYTTTFRPIPVWVKIKQQCESLCMSEWPARVCGRITRFNSSRLPLLNISESGKLLEQRLKIRLKHRVCFRYIFLRTYTDFDIFYVRVRISTFLRTCTDFDFFTCVYGFWLFYARVRISTFFTHVYGFRHFLGTCTDFDIFTHVCGFRHFLRTCTDFDIFTYVYGFRIFTHVYGFLQFLRTCTDFDKRCQRARTVTTSWKSTTRCVQGTILKWNKICTPSVTTVLWFYFECW